MSAGDPFLATAPVQDVREDALLFAGVGLFRYLFNGAIIAMDRSTMRILELEDRFSSPEELIGTDISDHSIHILPSGMLREAVKKNGRVQSLEYPLRTLNGTQKWVLHNSYMDTDAASGQPCIQAIIHDITDSVLARRALQESEARFRCIFEQAGIGIARVALTGDIVESNQTLRQMLGYTPAQLAQMRFSMLGYADDLLIDRELYDALLCGERDRYQVTKRFLCGNGHPLWCQLTFSLIRDAEGQPSFAIGMLEDITAREEAEVAKSRFLSVLTHELRTPLANITGWAREALESPELAADALQIILRNAESQSRMLNNLLEVSRLYYGRLTLQCENLDFREMVGQALICMQGVAEVRQVGLECTGPNVPLPIFADRKRILEMICNLLDNALKFTPAGGMVTVTVSRQGRSARLDIRDTGRGIQQEQLPLLFNLFPDIREPNATCGLRLGLALVKSIAELHSGQVAVESPGEDQGSTFTVILPCAA